MDKREWFALDMSTNEIYDYAMALQALADKRLELLKRCGSALVSLDNAFPNEMDVIDADLLSELAEAIDV